MTLLQSCQPDWTKWYGQNH